MRHKKPFFPVDEETTLRKGHITLWKCANLESVKSFALVCGHGGKGIADFNYEF